MIIRYDEFLFPFYFLVSKHENLVIKKPNFSSQTLRIVIQYSMLAKKKKMESHEVRKINKYA